jgi:hypothetical protein
MVVKEENPRRDGRDIAFLDHTHDILKCLNASTILVYTLIQGSGKRKNYTYCNNGYHVFEGKLAGV